MRTHGHESGQTTSTFRYSRTMVVLHWATAGLIAAAWLSAQIIDLFPRTQRGPYTSIHIFLGALAGIAVLSRILVRLWGTPRPEPEPGIADLAARVVHLVLYALVIAAVGLGILNAWVRGADVFGFFTFSSFTTDRDMRHLIGEFHELATNAILVLAAGHAMMALVHHFLLGDGVLRRMLPRG